MQDKLEERETEPCLELVEEKLRLAESELHCALQRAEQAEKRAMQLSTKGDTKQTFLILSTLEDKHCLLLILFILTVSVNSYHPEMMGQTAGEFQVPTVVMFRI